MSQDHHHDVIEDNIDTHPVKLAAGVAVGAIALVVAIILLAQVAVGLYSTRSLKGDPAMAPAVVAKRIGPVAQLAIDPNAPAVPTATAATAVAKVSVAAAPKAAGGKSIYDATCGVCHATGVAGAPKPGDTAAWAARVKGGKAALYESVLKGKGAMPAKGGNAALSEADVKAAVDYIVTAK